MIQGSLRASFFHVEPRELYKHDYARGHALWFLEFEIQVFLRPLKLSMEIRRSYRMAGRSNYNSQLLKNVEARARLEKLRIELSVVRRLRTVPVPLNLRLACRIIRNREVRKLTVAGSPSQFDFLSAENSVK